MKDGGIGIMILLGIIAIALFGGSKNAQNRGFLTLTPPQQAQTTNTSSTDSEPTIYDELKSETDNVSTWIKNEVSTHKQSEYWGKVDLSYIKRSSDPAYEYVLIKSNSPKDVPITGWSLMGMNNKIRVFIPTGTKIYFTGMKNGDETIILSPKDSLYLLTGNSPIGANFKINKCSGYLTQFQDFYPGLGGSCPSPSKEDLSSIPRTANNDACFDYIDRFPSCRIQTENLPANWSYECTHFIYDKITYPSCINTHKDDKDFFGNEWRVYLKRNEKLWKDSRDGVILYDAQGKIVDYLTV